MPLRILICDDEPAARFGMSKALRSIDAHLFEAEHGDAAIKVVRERRPHLVFLDLNMPVKGGLDVLRELDDAHPACEIIVLTADDELSTAIECMKLGAADYLTKPYDVERIRAIARRSLLRVKLEEENARLRDELARQSCFGTLIGASQPMRDLYARIERAAKAPLDILIRGETGTGKELIARELHRLGGRTGPFIAVNTAAISPTLAESELFGHVKGAFTGADTDRKGLFEQADGGTLFLDEVGDMPAPLQAKLLRVLQQRTIQRVGSVKEIAVDLRIVSATHQDLAAASQDGHFRQDLYFRLRGIELHVSPLRQRTDDIPLLARTFLDRLAAKASASSAIELSADAVAAMTAYEWPGNVRELEQVITAAAAMSGQSVLHASDLNLSARRPGNIAAIDWSPLMNLPLTEAKAHLIEQFERQAIHAALKAHDGNISAAARQLGIHRQNLQQKMNQLGIERA